MLIKSVTRRENAGILNTRFKLDVWQKRSSRAWQITHLLRVNGFSMQHWSSCHFFRRVFLRLLTVDEALAICVVATFEALAISVFLQEFSQLSPNRLNSILILSCKNRMLTSSWIVFFCCWIWRVVNSLNSSKRAGMAITIKRLNFWSHVTNLARRNNGNMSRVCWTNRGGRWRWPQKMSLRRWFKMMDHVRINHRNFFKKRNCCAKSVQMNSPLGIRFSQMFLDSSRLDGLRIWNT